MALAYKWVQKTWTKRHKNLILMII